MTKHGLKYEIAVCVLVINSVRKAMTNFSFYCTYTVSSYLKTAITLKLDGVVYNQQIP